jgi:ATP-dependent RNA helicase DDX21
MSAMQEDDATLPQQQQQEEKEEVQADGAGGAKVKGKKEKKVVKDKKEKKSSKKDKLSGDDGEDKKKRKKSKDKSEDGESLKKKKKRKGSEDEEEEAGIKRARIEEEVASPGGAAGKPERRPRTRSQDAAEYKKQEIARQAPNGTNPSVSDFPISADTKAQLAKRGITTLFPIQAQTFSHISEGKDLIGRARTGMGKTLAFALPIIERLLLAGDVSKLRRSPRVLVMAPTRELAKQVSVDFETTAPRLKTISIYGGAPYRPQEEALRYGVDIVVGTPGRIIDHMERGTLKLDKIEFFVLDESDQMLDMGFKEEMEKVFKACGKGRGEGGTVQTLLFSATMPEWVNQVARQYMAQDRVFIDLVGSSEVKASKDVSHKAIPCNWKTRASTIRDIISVFAAGGNKHTIVFCQTKKECNELCVDPAMTFECQPLHGDITQANRETTLAAFKRGSFKVLIATDVAARGLDMIVDVVINAEPPTTASGRVDTETYVHRSGRTGRAGRKGICITLYTPKHRGALKEIEKTVKNQFEWRGAPQPSDIIGAASIAASAEISSVEIEILPHFQEAAASLIAELGPEEALTRALACITGHTKELRARSLLSNSEGYVTCLFKNDKPIDFMSYVWTALRRRLDHSVTEAIRGMQLSADKTCAVFDVADQHIKQFKTLAAEVDWLELCQKLPELTVGKDEYRSNIRGSFGSSRGGGRGGRGGRVGGGGGRGGGRGRGRGRGRW